MSKEIKDLNIGDESAECYAIITNVTTGKTNGANKTTYLSFTFQDKTGSIDAKLWNAKPNQVEMFTSGVVVHIRGDIIKYGENRQMKIEKIKFYSDAQEEQVKYLKGAPVESSAMKVEIEAYLAQIQNEDMKKITEHIFNKYVNDMMVYPAASRNHHEYVSGLAHHTLSMLKSAEALSNIYPSLNKDYLYAGIILHDIGKTIELSGPVLPEYTLEGKLVGHISLSSAMVKSTADELNITGENVTILMHLILSHHGKMEFGSPVLPMIKEAEVIYFIDNLDARINMMDKALSDVEPGSFTKRMYPLENRNFYKPK